MDDKESGSVDLRFDYLNTATGKKGSAVLGRVEGSGGAALRLTILPAATKFEYRPVERVPLTKAKDRKQK
jgi:hypothetical protein